jgi:glycosyltransferase involved in cell wall biosynthesis
MRIAFIGQKGMPSQNGGVERYVESLALQLAALGQEVLVYNRAGYLPEKLTNYKGVQLIIKPFINTKNLANISHTFLAIMDVLRRRVDVVHFQGIGPSILCWLPKLFNQRIKVVATLHSFDYYNDKWSWPAKLMLRLGESLMCHQADQVIVVSKLMRDYVHTRYGCEALVIPNGANLYEEPGEDKILPWGLSKGNYIISVARIIKLKGLQYLIAAFTKLNTDKKLVIVGNGEYLGELEKLAANNQQIIFTNNQNGHTLDQLYANAYLFVQSSEMEGLSISLLEAMAHKTPSLVTANIEALGDTGFTFTSQDVTDLQAKLQNLLANPDLVAAKGREAYERAKQNFAWPDIAQKVLAVYNQVIK